MQPKRASNENTERYRVGGYTEYAPPPVLAESCESVWTHQTGRGPATSGGAHRVLPDVGVSLAFQGFRADGGEPLDWAPILIGPKFHAQVFTLVPGRELAAIRIKPEWVGPILGIDPLDIENEVAPLVQTHPGLGDRLSVALERTRSSADALKVFISLVMERQAMTSSAPSPLAAAALDLVRSSRGRLRCERAAGILGLSDRHFRRQVHDATGMAPKSYARALRFVSAMLAADGVERPAWTDVALDAGFCDQSHLIRDCVAMTGASPADLHRERRAQTIALL